MELPFATISNSFSKKKLFFALFAALLVAAAIVAAIVAAVESSRDNAESHNIHYSHPSHSIIKSACSNTLYPELCFSTVTAQPDLARKVSSPRDVVKLLLNRTTGFVQRNYFTVEKLLTRNSLTLRQKFALHSCLETIGETLDELHKAIDYVNNYPLNKSLLRHVDDLKTLISSAITNQETCLDGFSHEVKDKIFRKLYLYKGQVHVERLCSNALAVTTNFTDAHVANYRQDRKLIQEEGDGIKWPEWIPAADRRLLQANAVKPNVVVAADGSGNYRTVSAAVAAAPARSSSRYVIRIKAGVYRENVDVPSAKTNLMFVGDGRGNTIITASRNVADGPYGTYDTATVAIVGERFLARGITFQNAAGPSKHQAVALRVGADLSAFYECGFIAYQDTLYVHSNRQFFVNCYIAGTVDFIFGNSAVVIQNSDIHARRPNPNQKNMVTAQGRTDPNQNTGIVIQKCRIGATQDLEPVKGSFPTYLGRPWKEYSRTVVMQTSISDVIHPAGWFEWDGNLGLNTLYYGEYQNGGPGAGTSRRVKWKGFKVITSASEARGFTPANFISGSNWLPSTGFPYTLGL